MVAYTRLGILIGVRGYIDSITYLCFDVQDRQRIVPNIQEDMIVQQAEFLCIRVVAYGEGTWFVNPSPKKIDGNWKIWIYGDQKPLSKLILQNIIGLIHISHQRLYHFFNI
jgi:hypothetical protein